jgi:hypothetical protein
VLDAETIRELFAALDEELRARDVIGEIGLCGGAVMCLVFKARPATKDVDAIFEPTADIRKAAAAVARRHGLPEDWLNDAATGFFLSDPPRIPVLELPNLRVWAPTAEYMLAMKCVSARFDSHDRGDVEFLVRQLGLESADDVLAVVCPYYPKSMSTPAQQFGVLRSALPACLA